MGILKTISQGNRSAGGLGLPIVLALAGLPAALAAPGSAWDLEQRAAYVADMSQAEPRGALSSDGRPGTWKVVPFQTSVVSGKMLFASPSRQKPASELHLKAPVRGWHAVYVGMNYPLILNRPLLVKLRFDSDAAFTWFSGEEHALPRTTKTQAGRDVLEVFWKAANLSGQDLIIARKTYNPLRLWHAGADFNDNIASIAYLKLIPLSGREIAEMERQQGRPDTKRLVAINDMGWLRWVRSREELREELEPLRGTDVSMMLWGTFRGFYGAYFRTKAAAVPTGGDNEFNKFFSTFGEGMDRFRQLGIDPLEEAVNYAHRIGIRLLASIRMDGPKPTPYDGSPGPFFDRHPEYRLVAPDGFRMPRLSLAYPEVRRQYLAMFRETLDYGADGIAVVFNRNFPFVGWEDPVVRSFRARFHLDPRSLGPRDDEKFFQHQAEYVTTFLREIRALLDEYGGKRRERLQLAVEIGGNPPAFPYQPAIPDLRRSVLEFGWDVRTWIAAGSIDALILHPWSQLEVTEEETRVLSGWTRGSQVKFYVDFFPEQLDPEGIRAATLGYYAAGADGLCFWNTDLRVKRPGQWAMWRLLGHRQDLPEWQSFAQRLFRVVPLKSLAGRAFGSK